MDIMNKKVLVFGSGISGIAASRLLEKKGAKVILYDGNETLDKEKMRQQIGEKTQVEIVLGTFPEEILDRLSLVVMSPGVPTDLPIVKKMRAADIPIWGEIELAYAYGKGDVLAITGTNGKTTTTALLGEIMRSYNPSTYIVGNIGNPYTAVADTLTEDSVTVAEISSFQLETIDKFCPKVSAILNITPDHLNRHHTMEAYIRAKEDIAKNQTQEQVCVLNYEDEVLREFGSHVKADVIYFSSQRKLERGIYLEDECIIYNNEVKMELCHVDELKLLGIHNYENVMAAAAMALGFGAPLSNVRQAVKQFEAVEHRIEYVTEKRGIRFYNDSKATNPDAAIQGVLAMNRPTYLIGGGCDKGSSYDAWIASFGEKVKELILIGQTKEDIADAAKAQGFLSVEMADSLEEAVKICYRHAKSGDAVLLSPACASFGMFLDYEERGRIFKEIARRLEE